MKVRTRFYIFAAILLVFVMPVDLLHAGWPELDKLVASDGAADDNFGISVSVSGDYAIVGVHGDDNYSGSAYIYKRDGTTWSQQAKLAASDGAEGDRFGWSVSISGDYAIVGARSDDDNGSNSGSAYIFAPNEVDPNNWDQVAKLTASDGAEGDNFGWSVSISGDYAIVGAYRDDDNGDYSGSAYIFHFDGINWNQQAKLTASDGAAYDDFGYCVSISGDYVIVGAYGDNVWTGSAYIFKRDGTVWSEQTKLLASDGVSGDRFGWSVSISGDYAIIGAYGDDDKGGESGSAYIFKRDGAVWSEQAKLLTSDGAAYDYFGGSVSISGDYAIVGAYYDDDNGGESGSAYIYKRDGTVWSQQDKLLASDGAASDYFGYSVSVSGDYAIVGAYWDDDKGSSSGSAYMFVLCPYSDLTGDGFVDFADFALLAWWMGEDCNTSNQWCDEADLCLSGEVDYFDLAVFVEDWLIDFHLAAYWPLDDNDSNTFVSDISGNGHNGIASVNTELLSAPGIVNTCFDFGGTDVVEILDDDELSFTDDSGDKPFTIAAWIFVTASDATQIIVAKHDTGGKREYAFFLSATETLGAILYDESEGAFIQVTSDEDDALDPGWHFVAMTYDSIGGPTADTGVALYVDGAAVDSTASYTNTYVAMEADSANLTIGAWYVGAALTAYFQDKIDNVMLFSDVLTATEIAGLYNNL